ncbi:hypothetical protein CYR23_21220 [Chimaeribacter arupi]|nr:hypothetical protein CYR23_21220 [Chimaeribacter arupi]
MHDTRPFMTALVKIDGISDAQIFPGTLSLARQVSAELLEVNGHIASGKITFLAPLGIGADRNTHVVSPCAWYCGERTSVHINHVLDVVLMERTGEEGGTEYELCLSSFSMAHFSDPEMRDDIIVPDTYRCTLVDTFCEDAPF